MRNVYFRLLDTVAPPLSIRRQFLALCRQVPGVLRREGVGEVQRRTRQALIRYRETGALIIPEDAPPVQLPPLQEPEPLTYAEWITANEPGEGTLAEQRVQSARFRHRPLLSIIVPVFNPPVEALSAAVESVLAQTYDNWQLCIADGASEDPQIGRLLTEYAGSDSRIVVTRLERNLGISGNSNTALDPARGEFVALMDHDDVLAPNMLFEVVALLNRHRDADIVYFDEDKLSAQGDVRTQPWFKPGYSPEMMLSTNLLMHGVFRRSLLLEAGAFDPATDGAQDWDLALRCTRRTVAIHHIPMVLYHWRQIAGSASVDIAAKPWAFDAQVTALECHLKRTDGSRPTVTFPSPGRVRIRWPNRHERVSIIIPTKDQHGLLQACLESILSKTAYPDYEIILVDTGSTEKDTLTYYGELLDQHANVKIIRTAGEFNYSRANNMGAASATGELLLFLNNDTEVLDADWLAELAGWAARPQIGAVGAKLLRPNGLIQHAGIVMGLTGHGSHVFEDLPEDTYTIFGSTEWVRNHAAVTGACMMISAELFHGLSGFDENYRIAYSDIELCLRAEEAGYRTVYTPFARLLHHEGGSRGSYVPPSDVLRASAQMLPRIRQDDRYYNSNLSLHHRIPSLGRPDEPEPAQTIVQIMRAYRLLPPHLPEITPPIQDVDLALPAPWPQTNATPRTMTDGDLSVLLAVHDLSLSGAPLLLAALASQLAKSGIRLTLISPEDGPVRAAFESAGVTVHIAPSMRDSFHGTSLLTRTEVGALTRAVESHDLVLANSIVSALAIHAATAYHKPSIYWLHESQFGYRIAVHDSSVQAALRSAGLVILPTQHLADLYRDYLPEDCTVVMPYGLDVSTLAAHGEAIALPPDKVCVVNIGSLEPRKGQDYLLSSILKLPDKVRDHMEFYFLGRTIDPAFADSLYAQANSLPNVHFKGNLAHDQTMAYLDAADIFVLSSRDEVLPVSMLEAMHHKLAIIATRAGGVAEAIQDGESGLLVNFGDRRRMTHSLQTLALDPAMRKHLGENAARTFDERYTMRIFLQRFTDLIERLTRAPDREAASAPLQPAQMQD